MLAKLVGIGISLVISSTAFANVVDKFSCTSNYTDAITGFSFSMTNEVNSVRTPWAYSGGLPPVVYESGRLVINTHLSNRVHAGVTQDYYFRTFGSGVQYASFKACNQYSSCNGMTCEASANECSLGAYPDPIEFPTLPVPGADDPDSDGNVISEPDSDGNIDSETDGSGNISDDGNSDSVDNERNPSNVGDNGDTNIDPEDDIGYPYPDANWIPVEIGPNGYPVYPAGYAPVHNFTIDGGSYIAIQCRHIATVNVVGGGNTLPGEPIEEPLPADLDQPTLPGSSPIGNDE